MKKKNFIKLVISFELALVSNMFEIFSVSKLDVFHQKMLLKASNE